MNLHINLILDTEMRSSSRISRKFIIKIAAGVAVLLFSSFIVIVLSGAYYAKQARVFAEQEKKQMEPVYRTVLALNQELNDLQNLTNSINVWAKTRPDWNALFLGMQSVVPASIQLTKMTMNEVVSPVDNVPVRFVTMYMSGRVAIRNSETDVQTLEKSLREKPPFNEVMESAQVKQFDTAKNLKEQNVRVFDVECRFKAQKLYQPVKLKAQ